MNYRIVRTAMNKKQKVHRFILATSLFAAFGMMANFSFLGDSASAAPTTWQKFVEEKCNSGTADAAERCADKLERDLKRKCGEPKRTDKYTNCWRTFIRDNGGSAGNNSSPFEKETPSNQFDNDNGADVSNPIAGDDCGGVKTAIIKCEADNSGDIEDNGIWALLLIVLNVLTTGVGVLAVAGIVYGAILYTTAGDKADQVKKSTEIITSVVIGLILFALMWAGLNFIVPGGVFA